jgi:hypothetical protein
VRETLRQLFPGLASRVADYRGRLFDRSFGETHAAPVEGEFSFDNLRRRIPRWTQGLILLAAVALYSLLILRVVRNWDSEALRDIQIWLPGIAFASLAQIIGYLLFVSLWARLFNWLNYPLHFFKHLKVYAYSGLANKLPGFFWSVATKIYLYGRYGVARSATAVNIGLELLMMGVAASMLTLLVSILSPGREAFLPLWVSAGALLVCLAGSHPQVLQRLLRLLPNPDLAESFNRLQWSQVLLTIAGHTLVILLGGTCLFGVIAAVVGFDAGLYSLAVQTWALTMLWSTLLAWLPSDFGLRQGPFLVMLTAVFPGSLVVVLLVAWRLWFNVMEVLWGGCGLAIALFWERKTGDG